MAAASDNTDTEEPKLEELPTTDSGAVRKKQAMAWMQSLDEPDEEAMKEAVVPKPYNHEGSTFPEPITRIRIDGHPDYITEVAKMFKMMLDLEGINTRLSINLQQVEDSETGELRDDVYALYLSVAERG